MIVDASAVFLALVGAPDKPFRNEQLLAPDLIVAEVLNAIWKVRRAGVPAPEVTDALSFIDKIDLVQSRQLADRAVELARELDHPIYDCMYLALADRLDASLLTGDARLIRKLGRHPIATSVRLISATGA